MSVNLSLVNLLKEKRPNISISSIKTYESILRNLYDKIWDEDKGYDWKRFDTKADEVLGILKDLPYNKRKTVLSALVIITDNTKYRELMLDDIKEYNKEQAKQIKTESMTKNWVSKQDIVNLFDEYKNESNILYKKKALSSIDLNDIQNFIILSLLSGIIIPPRRSKDFVKMKINNIDKNKDNYIDKNEFVFNDYKTAKTYGRQSVEIPKPLKAILNKWLKVNKTDYLLFDVSRHPLTNVKLNQRLNKIFGKKAGVNMMRKSYLSDKYGDTIKIKNDMDEDFKKMGSSSLQENIYIKKE